MNAALLVVVAVLILAASFVAIGIARGWFRNRGGATGFLTAYHDLQPKDRQEAIEQVIEQKAGKRWGMDLSGEGDNEGKGERKGESRGKGGGEGEGVRDDATTPPPEGRKEQRT